MDGCECNCLIGETAREGMYRQNCLRRDPSITYAGAFSGAVVRRFLFLDWERSERGDDPCYVFGPRGRSQSAGLTRVDCHLFDFYHRGWRVVSTDFRVNARPVSSRDMTINHAYTYTDKN